eukprot:scaffold66575_cov31-Tisochrysis_lutea.AAC.8
MASTLTVNMQGQLVVEAVMEHLASSLGCSVDLLRRSNWYKEGEELTFGTVLEEGEWRIPRAFDELAVDADITERQKQVDDFNRAHRSAVQTLSP